MKQITEDVLKRIALVGSPTIMSGLALEFQSAFASATPAGITTVLRAAHFLAQAAYETDYFRAMEENLHYSAARIPQVWERLKDRAEELAGDPERLGNAAYANVLGNGDEASGDGYRFRGRGCFDLTGRDNYVASSKSCGQDFASNPDLVAQSHWAVVSAIEFWKMRDVGAAADLDNVAQVTKLVTGSSIGLQERAILKHRALAVLSA